jgi:phage FluMu protein Com
MLPSNQSVADWRCHECGKLLAKRQGNQLHIEIAGKYRYIVDGRVTSVCPRCETLNSEQTAQIVPAQ